MLAYKMQRIYSRILGYSLLLAAVVGAAFPVRANEPVAVILRVANGADPAALAADYNAILNKSLPAHSLARLVGHNPQLLSQLSADPRVLAAHADKIIVGQPRLIGAVGSDMNAQPRLIGAVGDPVAAYGEQWAAAKLRLPQAHTITAGQGMIVAVLDTGVTADHPLLDGYLLPGYDFVDNDAFPDDTAGGIDEDGDGQVDEAAGHGTHVAGIVRLTAPQAQILPVRIFDDEGQGSYFDAVAGILYAVDQGAHVINLSGSGPDDVPFLEEAVAYAEAHGVVMVAAAGVNLLGYPAQYSSVISVAAANDQDYPTDFSTFPEMAPTVYAPGAAIFSAYYTGDYAWWTGNSMAAPFVAGTAALMRASANCDAACVRANLLPTAHRVVTDPYTQVQHGRVDAFDAVARTANQFHPTLSVQLMAGPGQPYDLAIKPFLQIVNNGNSVPLHELTLRYYYTREGNAGEQVHCDYAAISCAHLTGAFGVVTGTPAADAYLELHFNNAAGRLLGGRHSGPIQLRLHKNDWSAYDEMNDYSRNGAAQFTTTSQVALYHNGQLVWGTPPGVPPPTPEPPPPPEPPVVGNVRVQYLAADTHATNQAMRPHLRLLNVGNTAIPLADLTLRYWFTNDNGAPAQVWCDYAAVNCGNITAFVGSSGSQAYLEVTFTGGAGELAAGGNSGPIQLRLHHVDWLAFNENSDFSFNPAMTTFTDWQNITLYQNSQLIWGVEP